nr:metallophosphoesterase [Anaerolineae bacterium]
MDRAMDSQPGIPEPVSRRAFLKWALRAVGAGAAVTTGGTVYCFRLEPGWLQYEPLTVPIASLPPCFEGYRLIHLTDFHLETELSYRVAARAVALSMDHIPDIILLTGDYISHILNSDRLRATLAPLSAPDGVYATLGNHDHWVDSAGVRHVLDSLGIVELNNTCVPITRGADQLWIAGIDDVWERQHNLSQALDGLPDNAATILLCHEPDYADEVVKTGRVDLQLSGHSHGGQVTLPFLGSPITPYLGSKYARGLYRVDNMWLYTNRGVGNLLNVRLNCRPEVAEITLTGA